jgi:hypothetical protein
MPQMTIAWNDRQRNGPNRPVRLSTTRVKSMKFDPLNCFRTVVRSIIFRFFDPPIDANNVLLNSVESASLEQADRAAPVAQAPVPVRHRALYRPYAHFDRQS